MKWKRAILIAPRLDILRGSRYNVFFFHAAITLVFRFLFQERFL